jgi:hypothetical protein
LIPPEPPSSMILLCLVSFVQNCVVVELGCHLDNL